MKRRTKRNKWENNHESSAVKVKGRGELEKTSLLHMLNAMYTPGLLEGTYKSTSSHTARWEDERSSQGSGIFTIRPFEHDIFLLVSHYTNSNHLYTFPNFPIIPPHMLYDIYHFLLISPLSSASHLITISAHFLLNVGERIQ
jgi:hypothetical protein